MSSMIDKIDNSPEQVKKITVTLENAQDKLQTMAEIQENHYMVKASAVGQNLFVAA